MKLELYNPSIFKEVFDCISRAVDAHSLRQVLLQALVGKLTGCDDSHGLRFADAFVAHQLLNRGFGKRHEAVSIIGENSSHDVDCRLPLHTTPDEDGKQFCLAQRVCTIGKQPFAWPVFRSPFLD